MDGHNTGTVGVYTREGDGAVTLTIPPEHLDDFRLMLREQIGGDVEALRWLVEHGEPEDRRAPHLGADRLRVRLRFLWDLAERTGGLY